MVSSCNPAGGNMSNQKTGLITFLIGYLLTSAVLMALAALASLILAPYTPNDTAATTLFIVVACCSQLTCAIGILQRRQWAKILSAIYCLLAFIFLLPVLIHQLSQLGSLRLPRLISFILFVGLCGGGGLGFYALTLNSSVKHYFMTSKTLDQ